jgi:hypothetical protein
MSVQPEISLVRVVGAVKQSAAKRHFILLAGAGYAEQASIHPLKIQKQLNRRGTEDTEKYTEEGVSP